ncbi:MAG: carboxypeptidase regulatory-like domain-containing protein [Planctomycetaceae bacterium]|nr:carboxypeptidase regulatory-like domain-containing protein [Planctomycetaceae bacterium]
MQRLPKRWNTIIVWTGGCLLGLLGASSEAREGHDASEVSVARSADESHASDGGLLQMAEDADAPAAGVIKGGVTKNGRELKRSRVVVEIEGLGEKFRKRVDANGKFEFTEVPQGKYKLVASGTFKNVGVEGAVEDVEPAPAAKAEAVTISLK